MIDQLTDFLDGPYAEVRRDVRHNLTRPELAPAFDLSTREHRARVLDQLELLAEEGDVARGFPVEHGGKGEVGQFVTAFEELGHGDLSLLVKVGVQFGLFGGAIQQLGTDAHHERWLPDLMAARLLGGFAMTERGHGSDVQSLLTTATYDPDTEEFVIDTPSEAARKDWIGNAAEHGHAVVCFAQLITQGEGHGVHAFFVPIRDRDTRELLPDVEIEDCGEKIGLNGVDNGRIAFRQVRVPRTNLLDRFGSVDADGTYSSPIDDPDKRFFTMLGTLVQGRVSVSGASLSAAKNALLTSVRWSLERRQFSPPDRDDEVLLMDYLSQQRRLLTRVADAYALSCAQNHLVADLHDVLTGEVSDERERRKLESRAAGIKAITTWFAVDAIQTARESVGGRGYLQENRLGQLRDDIDVFTTFEGDNTVLLQLVTKGLLTSYRDEFSSMDLLDTVRFAADQVIEAVVEWTAARSLIQTFKDNLGNDEDADVRDRAYQLDLLEYRENHIIDGLGKRLKKGMDAGYDAFDVFNRSQDHVLLAARAHIDRVILESFVASIEEVDDPGTRDLLEKVCDLHVLSLLERERGWFLEHGRFTGNRSKAIIDAVNDACRELRPYARELVDAFAIPDEALVAPLAGAHGPTV